MRRLGLEAGHRLLQEAPAFVLQAFRDWMQPIPISRATCCGSQQLLAGLPLLQQAPSQQCPGQHLSQGAPAQWPQKADHTAVAGQGSRVSFTSCVGRDHSGWWPRSPRTFCDAAAAFKQTLTFFVQKRQQSRLSGCQSLFTFEELPCGPRRRAHGVLSCPRHQLASRERVMSFRKPVRVHAGRRALL